MQIAFEPHPVSPERKRELRAAGFKIIDARFAPKGEADEIRQEEAEAAPEAVTVKRRGRPPRSQA